MSVKFDPQDLPDEDSPDREWKVLLQQVFAPLQTRWRKGLRALRWSGWRYALALDHETLLLVRASHWRCQLRRIALPPAGSVRPTHLPLLPPKVLLLVEQVLTFQLADPRPPPLDPLKRLHTIETLAAPEIPCELRQSYWRYRYLDQAYQLEVVSPAMLETMQKLLAPFDCAIDAVSVSAAPTPPLPPRFIRPTHTWPPLAQQACAALFQPAIPRAPIEATVNTRLLRRWGYGVILALALLNFSTPYLSPLLLRPPIEHAPELQALQQQHQRLAQELAAHQRQLRLARAKTEQTIEQQQVMSKLLAFWLALPPHTDVQMLRWQEGRITAHLSSSALNEFEAWRHTRTPNQGSNMQVQQIQKDRDAHWRITVSLQ